MLYSLLFQKNPEYFNHDEILEKYPVLTDQNMVRKLEKTQHKYQALTGRYYEETKKQQKIRVKKYK